MSDADTQQQDTTNQPQDASNQAQDTSNRSEDTSNQEGSTEKAEETTSKPSTGNKLEHPDAIPTAGGKQLGEDHKGESKMLSDNARSESTAAAGGDDLQKQLEGKKVADKKGDGEGEEKKGMVEKAKEKLGMGHKD